MWKPRLRFPACSLPAAMAAATALGGAFAPLTPASAVVGSAGAAPAPLAATLVMIVSRSTFCTGTAIGRALVLTAAHCVLPGAEYKLFDYDSSHKPMLRDIAEVVRHPQFDLRTLLAHRATADVAVLKLAAPLPARFAPALVPATSPSVKPDDPFVLAGYGVAVRGDGKTGGTARAATLVATGHPGTLQVRLVDPATRNQKPGLGACTGDSGAPVFVPQGAPSTPPTPPTLVGVVSWSTGPHDAAGCGGLTGVTPLALYAPWIMATARRMGARFAQ